jgi:hypothetical protein
MFIYPSGDLQFLAPFWTAPTGSGTRSPSADGFYQGEDLHTLKSALERATDAVAAQPEEWEEFVPDPLHPEAKPRPQIVRRASLSSRLHEILRGIELASQLKGVVELVYR